MNAPTIEIDPDSGFCFGVVTAITKAEQELDRTGTLYCLGDIVHNSDEVERLKRNGLITITHADMEKLHNVKVLLRAHGEPPSTYELARKNNIEIIDATCPVVLQLQKRIKAAANMQDGNLQIVIYGKEGHAEVNGLVGQTDGRAIVVQNKDELDKLNPDNPVALYSQTTMSVDGFAQISDEIRRHCSNETSFNSYDTICRQVANRAPKLKQFARKHDLILFVSGKKSSNGKFLFSECLAVNPESHLISNESEIDARWLDGKNTIGICGATSTPRWLMEKVREAVSEIVSKK